MFRLVYAINVNTEPRIWYVTVAKASRIREEEINEQASQRERGGES